MDQNPNDNPAPSAGPTSAPAAGPDSAPERVKSVWQRGWFYPCFYGMGPFLAAPAAIIAFRGINNVSRGGWIFIAVMVVAAALLFTTGFRRKVTVTDDTLIVRNLFTRKVLPLHEITEMKLGLTQGHSILSRSPVDFRTANKRSASTMAFGSQNYLAMGVISEAAIAKGAKIIGYNAEREVG